MLMNSEDIQRALDDVFDQAIVFHCFTDYMGDYEIITYSVADPRRLSQLSWRLRCVAAVERHVHVSRPGPPLRMVLPHPNLRAGRQAMRTSPLKAPSPNMNIANV